MDGSANSFLFHRHRFDQSMDWAPTITMRDGKRINGCEENYVTLSIITSKYPPLPHGCESATTALFLEINEFIRGPTFRGFFSNWWIRPYLRTRRYLYRLFEVTPNRGILMGVFHVTHYNAYPHQPLY